MTLSMASQRHLNKVVIMKYKMIELIIANQLYEITAEN